MAIAIAGANLDFLLTMRQKYMDGGGELLIGPGGVSGANGTDNGVAWPGTSPGFSATGQLAAAALATDQQITLRSASEAAQFRPGDPIVIFSWDATGAIVGPTAATVTASKNQNLLFGAALGAAHPTASLVGRRFGVGPDGVSTSLDVNALGWTPVGAGDIAAMVDLYQRLCSQPAAALGAFTMSAVANPTITLNAPGSASVVDTLIGDRVTFIGNNTATLAGATARITSNTTGPIVLGLDQITAINGAGDTVTSAEFPIVIDGVSTSPIIGDRLNIRSTFVSSKTDAVDVPNNVNALGNVAVNPQVGAASLLGVSQEGLGDQGPVMVAACLGIIDQLGGTARLSLSQEEKLMGSFGAIGKRLLLAQDELAAATTIILEWDEAAGDVPFPLAGIINIIDGETGVNSVAFSQPLLIHTSTYTRLSGSRTLTLAAAIPVGGVTTGMIVQLAPGQSGPVFKPYASAIEAKDMVQLMNLTKLAVEAHTIPTP